MPRRSSAIALFVYAAAVTLGLSSQAFAFIPDYAPRLPPDAPANAVNVANAIDAFKHNGGVLPAGFNAFGTIALLTGTPLSNALQQLAGEAGATGGRQVATQFTNSFLSLMLNGYVGNRGSFGGFGPAANGFAAEQQQMPETVSAYAALERATGRRPPGEQRWHSWGSAYGGQSNTSGDTATGSNSTRAAAFGLAAGMDYHPSADAVVGFALAGGRGNWNIANGNGGGRSDVFQAGLYGSQQFGASYVSAAASYAWHSMSTNRTAVAGDTLTANFDANNIAGRLESGHRFDAPMSFAITPYAAAQVQAFYLPGYTESETVVSNQYALSYTSRTATTIRSELGAWFDTRSLVGNGNTTLFSRIAWAHDWNSDPTVSASFPGLPGTSFTVNGAAPPTNLALVTAGAEFRLSRDVILSAKFDGGFAGGYQSYAGTGTLRYFWN